MHNVTVIRPIESFSHDEIRDAARAAADEGRPQHEANPFPDGSTQHVQFSHCYWERHRQNNEVEA